MSAKIEAHIGARIREQRRLCGLNQEKLGVVLGVTLQQIQKFETGKNRISASQLLAVARALNVDFAFFFDRDTDEHKVTAARHGAGMSAPQFVGDATREPQLRIGVLMATLRHARQDVDLAFLLLEHDLDGARKTLAKASADIAEKLELMEKADRP